MGAATWVGRAVRRGRAARPGLRASGAPAARTRVRRRGGAPPRGTSEGEEMAVRHGLLVLLAEGEQHGFGLRQAFERRTGGTWPLNVGQVYTTLNRLVRDGLVTEVRREDDGAVIYGITDAGRTEVQRWWGTPVDRGSPARDELAIKVALAVCTPGVDAVAVVRRQRGENMARLQQYTAVKRRATATDRAGAAWQFVLDHLIFAAEAEARWLDHVEARLSVGDLPMDLPGSAPGDHDEMGRDHA